MPDPAPQRPLPSPTWKQVGAGAFAVFAVALAFLAGRVRAGTDPAIARTATPAQAPVERQAAPAPDQGSGSGSGAFADPGTSGGSEQVAPDPDPPTTQAS